MTLAPARLKELNAHLMLFYTGIRRTASEVAASYGTAATVADRSLLLKKMREFVDQSCEILNSRQDLADFGKLMHEAWLAKRSLSEKVSNPQIDSWYETALANGALGGKLLGAGGGGFLLFFVAPENQAKVKAQFSQLIHVPFEFEFGGSQIIFFDLEEDFSQHEQCRSRQHIRDFEELNPASPLAAL